PPHAMPQVLRAQLSDLSTFASLLRSVAFSNHATVTASQHGLEVVTEMQRSVQAHAYLYTSIFNSYEFNQPPRKKRKRRSSREPSSNKLSVTNHGLQGDQPSGHQSGQNLTSSRYQQDEADSESDPEGSQDAEDPEPDPDSDEVPSITFEIDLRKLLTCLNIFGGAGPAKPTFSNTKTSRFGSRRGGDGSNPYDRQNYNSRDLRDGFEARGDREGSVLSSLGGRTRMDLRYDGHGHPLALSLEESGVKTLCQLSTFEAGFLTDLSFDHENTVSQVIMRSELLHSSFTEIDQSCNRLDLIFSNKYGSGPKRNPSDAQPMFVIRAQGDLGSSEMEFPSSDRQVTEKFSTVGNQVGWSYNYKHFMFMLPALRNSIKTSLRIDDRGLASFQFMIPKHGVGEDGGGDRERAEETYGNQQGHAFVEFLVSLVRSLP
ncbi:Rad1-domain-containing protein, partial [Violaceomyces palustris]